MCEPISSKTQEDWRAENDHGTLMRAAEVMADKIRMKGVMAHMKKSRRAISHMEQMLAFHRRSNGNGDRDAKG